MKTKTFVLLLGMAASRGWQVAEAQNLGALGAEPRQYLRVSTANVVLTHVELIDGTGGPALPDRNITVEGGKIVAITPGADRSSADGATVLDLRGYSVMPGIVGMHNHLWYSLRPDVGTGHTYQGPSFLTEMSFSAPRLYLANGVTTMRTAGSVNPYTDLKLKQAIEGGSVPGPHLDVTGLYLDHVGNPAVGMFGLNGPDDARETVKFWAERGVTSFKAYSGITREELRAAIAEAHAHGLKVTGHLCSVTYPEAIEAGIDNLEHGFTANTQLDPDKKPDTCSASAGDFTLDLMIPGSVEANRLIASLVSHHVAITSTMVLRALSLGRESPPGTLDAMTPAGREAAVSFHNRPIHDSVRAKATARLRREMDLEHAFVTAGGLLLAGPDPAGIGGLVPGFADQQEIELLVEAGFTPVQAIRIATLNGAVFLGREREIGSIAVGKNADLVVMKGDPVTRIRDIENVEIVFKDGVGYDTGKLLESVRGHYGEY